VVEAPNTSLDELMFVHLGLFYAGAPAAGGTPGKQTDVFVFVFVLLSTFVHCLAQPERLGVAWIVSVIIMKPALEHHLFKALPACHHDHLSLVPTYEQGVCSLSLLGGDACMCGSVCSGLYKAHAHGDRCEAMHACANVGA
jgi:hypothetical protein